MSDKAVFKVLKSARSWVWDWLIDHWPTLFAFIVGGGGMGYLARVTTWINEWGPIAWGGAFLIGAYLSAGVYVALAWASSRRIQNQLAERAFNKSGVSPLEGSYEKQRISIADFYNPYYVTYKNRRFHSCQIWGPAQIVMVGSTVMTGCDFRHCQIVIAKENTMLFGATVFENVTFVDCEMSNLTLIMPHANYDSLVQLAPDFMQHIPVISESP